MSNQNRKYKTISSVLNTSTINPSKIPLTDNTRQKPINPVNPNMSWTSTAYSNTADPEVWGPAFWFTLHNGAAHVPENPSPVCMQKIKGFIDGIPEMISCATCSKHARDFIDERKKFMDQICITRDNLFNFFVDFHNYVNIRHNKPVMSYEDASKIYKSGVNVSKLTYKN